MSDLPKTCVNCEGDSLFSTRGRSPFAGELYPDLGAFLTPPEVIVVVCQSCGHSSLFVDQEARNKLVESPHWKKL